MIPGIALLNPIPDSHTRADIYLVFGVARCRGHVLCATGVDVICGRAIRSIHGLCCHDNTSAFMFNFVSNTWLAIPMMGPLSPPKAVRNSPSALSQNHAKSVLLHVFHCNFDANIRNQRPTDWVLCVRLRRRRPGD